MSEGHRHRRFGRLPVGQFAGPRMSGWGPRDGNSGDKELPHRKCFNFSSWAATEGSVCKTRVSMNSSQQSARLPFTSGVPTWYRAPRIEPYQRT